MRTECLKCSACGYITPLYYTNKVGTLKTGWARLREHFFLTHGEEWEALQVRIRKEQS